MTDLSKEYKLSLLCWNIGNPSIERAGKQAQWLLKRPETVIALTETKQSQGCQLLERYLQAFNYHVFSSKPEDNEFGIIILSKQPFKPSNFMNLVKFLPSRIASVTLGYQNKELEIIVVYVPSRDSSYEKILKKKHFLENLNNAFNFSQKSEQRLFCGDLNILEPNHEPHYMFFKDWEYNFYKTLRDYELQDAFRYLNPMLQEYSWVGRTGDGYRYDHCFVTNDLLTDVKKCFYLHEPRETRLSDHSALVIEINI